MYLCDEHAEKGLYVFPTSLPCIRKSRKLRRSKRLTQQLLLGLKIGKGVTKKARRVIRKANRIAAKTSVVPITGYKNK